MARESGPCRAIMAISSGSVVQLEVGKALGFVREVPPVLQAVRGVHDEQVLVGAEPV